MTFECSKITSMHEYRLEQDEVEVASCTPEGRIFTFDIAGYLSTVLKSDGFLATREEDGSRYSFLVGTRTRVHLTQQEETNNPSQFLCSYLSIFSEDRKFEGNIFLEDIALITGKRLSSGITDVMFIQNLPSHLQKVHLYSSGDYNTIMRRKTTKKN